MRHNNIVFKVSHGPGLENRSCDTLSDVHGIIIDLRLTGLAVEQLLAGLSIVGADIIAEMIGSIVIHGQKQTALIVVTVIIFIDDVFTANIIVKCLSVIISVFTAEHFIIAED